MTNLPVSEIMDRPVRLLNAGDGHALEIRDLETDELLASVLVCNLATPPGSDADEFENDLD